MQDILPTTAHHAVVAVSEFERYLRVTDIHGAVNLAVVLDDASDPREPGELAVNVTNTPEGESVCCGTTGCTESGLTSVVGHGFAAGLEPDTCDICAECFAS